MKKTLLLFFIISGVSANQLSAQTDSLAIEIEPSEVSKDSLLLSSKKKTAAIPSNEKYKIEGRNGNIQTVEQSNGKLERLKNTDFNILLNDHQFNPVNDDCALPAHQKMRLNRPVDY